ncbi:response regulator, partial [Acinetobacter baumannii]
ALDVIRDFAPDLLVLDVMMPGIDGVELLTRVRAAGNDVPVLFLTAKDAVEDRIAGIAAGGDDYVTKPFNLEEVILRLRGMARRHVAAA